MTITALLVAAMALNPLPLACLLMGAMSILSIPIWIYGMLSDAAFNRRLEKIYGPKEYYV